MKAAILHGPRDFRVENVSNPKLEPDGIIVRVGILLVSGQKTTFREMEPCVV